MASQIASSIASILDLRLQTSDFEDALSAGLRGREGFDGAVKGVPPLPSLVDDEQRLEA